MIHWNAYSVVFVKDLINIQLHNLILITVSIIKKDILRNSLIVLPGCSVSATDPLRLSSNCLIKRWLLHKDLASFYFLM